MNGISSCGNKIQGVKKHITRKKKGDSVLSYESRFKKALGIKDGK